MCGRFALGSAQDGAALPNNVRNSYFGRDASEEFDDSVEENGSGSNQSAEASGSGNGSGNGNNGSTLSGGGSSSQVKVQWKDDSAAPGYRKRYNIAPQTFSPIMTRISPTMYSISFAKFGLIPQFETKERLNTINCRSDSLFEGGGLWGKVRGNRCVVVMDGWYEWEVKNDGKTRLPWFMKRKEGGVLALAGLCDVLDRDNEPPTASFTIITVNAPEPLRFLHDRSPAILTSEQAIIDWLHPGPWEKTKHEKLIRSLSPTECRDHIMWYRVLEDVGKVGVDRAELTQPITERKGNIANMFAAQVSRQAASPTKPTIVTPSSKNSSATPPSPSPKQASAASTSTSTPTQASSSKPKLTPKPKISRSRSSSIEIIEPDIKPKEKKMKVAEKEVVKKKKKQKVEVDEDGNPTIGNFFKPSQD